MTTDSLLDLVVPPSQAAALIGGTVVTIGNFDGVHRGHQQIMGTIRAAATALGAKAVALTFEPHPTEVFQKRDPATFRLTTSETRAALLKTYGIDEVVTIPFSCDFADLSAEDFVHKLLDARLHTREVHIGYDFAFGRGREGTTASLQELCSAIGITVRIHPAYGDDETPISSTRVRAALRAHAMEEVSDLLGRPYRVLGQQAPGAQRGRTMGVPTINIYPDGLLMPPNGVYVSTLVADGRRWRAITNVGIRPTFADDDRLSVETFILEDFEGLEGGTPLAVELHTWLREERPFDSQDALRTQIGADVARANAFHASVTTG